MDEPLKATFVEEVSLDLEEAEEGLAIVVRGSGEPRNTWRLRLTPLEVLWLKGRLQTWLEGQKSLE